MANSFKNLVKCFKFGLKLVTAFKNVVTVWKVFFLAQIYKSDIIANLIKNGMIT